MNTFIGQWVRSKSFFPIPHPPFPFPRSDSSYQCVSITLPEFLYTYIYIYVDRIHSYHFNSFQLPVQTYFFFFICPCLHVTFVFSCSRNLLLGVCVFVLYTNSGDNLYLEILSIVWVKAKKVREPYSLL